MLKPAEKNYNVTQREALGMIYALDKLRDYLLVGEQSGFPCGSSSIGLFGQEAKVGG